jgi:plastocyanin
VFAVPATLPAASVHVAEIEVKIDNFAVVPQRVAVKAGTTVHLDQRRRHPAYGHLKHESLQVERTRYERQILVHVTRPGTYEYFCSLYPHITGAIVVQAGTRSNAAQ